MIRMFIRFFSVIICLFPALAFGFYHPVTDVTVTVLKEGQPVPGAKVVLVNGNLEELYTITRADGTCSFEYHAPDSLSFISCWESEEGPVLRRCLQIDAGDNSEILFELKSEYFPPLPQTPLIPQEPKTVIASTPEKAEPEAAEPPKETEEPPPPPSEEEEITPETDGEVISEPVPEPAPNAEESEPPPEPTEPEAKEPNA